MAGGNPRIAGTHQRHPLELINLYEDLWEVGDLLFTDECMRVLDDDYRPWGKVLCKTEVGVKFYATHDRNKPEDLLLLRAYQQRKDIASYKAVLLEIMKQFGESIHESLETPYEPSLWPIPPRPGHEGWGPVAWQRHKQRRKQMLYRRQHPFVNMQFKVLKNPHGLASFPLNKVEQGLTFARVRVFSVHPS